MLKKVFTTKTSTGADVTLAIVKPTPAQMTEAQMKYNIAFNDAINSKAPLRDRIDDVLRSQGLWSDERENKYNDLQKKILDAQLKIQKGGKGNPVNELAKLALEVMRLREEMVEMSTVRTKLDTVTVEGISDNARLNYLFSVCLVDNETGKPFFKSYDDYLNSNESDVVNEGLKHFYSFIIGADSVSDEAFEKKFLKKFKFMDDKNRLIEPKTGRLIDLEGKYIDEFGRWVKYNDDGSHYFVDINGNKVNPETGEFDVECEGYYDSDGNRLDVENEPKQKEEILV